MEPVQRSKDSCASIVCMRIDAYFSELSYTLVHFNEVTVIADINLYRV